jgi:serine/threonine-protein kinase SRPK3
MSGSFDSSDSSNSDDSYNSNDLKDELFKGELLNNKYILLYRIGQGTFSTVWLALNIHNNKYYAIKIQNCEDYEDGIIEVETLNKISKGKHQCINNINENFIFESEHGSHVCMVFELLAGSVYDIMKCEQYKTGLPYQPTKIIIYQLIKAMHIINDKYHLLHTDIKPENILVVGTNKKIKNIIQTIQNNTALFKSINKKNKLSRETIKKMVQSMDFNTVDKYQNNFEVTNDILVKLSDFGTCREIDYKYYDIQTRYYRSPEVILGYKYNNTCDLWSVGCLIYELLTGEVLFNPDKKKRLSTDRSHIYTMITILGKIPQKLIDSSEYKNEFYTKNGLLKGITGIQYNLLHNIIIEKLSHKISREQLHLMIDLLGKLLQFDPFKRPSLSEVLNHAWFDDLNKKKY